MPAAAEDAQAPVGVGGVGDVFGYRCDEVLVSTTSLYSDGSAVFSSRQS